MNENIPSLDAGLRFVLGISLFVLLPLMATKEIVQLQDSKMAKRIASYLTGPILSLLVVFTAIFIITVKAIIP